MNENLAVGRGFFVVFSSMTGKHTHADFVFRADGAAFYEGAVVKRVGRKE